MSMPSLRSLLEVGAHFGHKKQHSHPAARRFVYTIKEGVLVIDLEKTIEHLVEAVSFMKKILRSGGTILFVGTKLQARDALKRTAIALNQPYVSTRWLGGTLTNFDTVKKSLFRLEELEKKINDPSFETLKKRERFHLKEKHGKLTAMFEGMVKLSKAPDAMFIVDASYEDIAVAEANRLGIPVVALTDTNVNPDIATCIIPANDESKRAVELIMDVIAAELGDVEAEVKDERIEPKKEARPKRQAKQAKAVKKVKKVAKPTGKSKKSPNSSPRTAKTRVK